MTYFWRDGEPVGVDVDQYGRPKQLRWKGKKHTIRTIENRWIIDDNWWVKRTWRDYYQVKTYTGLLLIIFRDIPSVEWYVQRLYD